MPCAGSRSPSTRAIWSPCGPFGSDQSTLMNILGCLEIGGRGKLPAGYGTEVGSLDDDGLAAILHRRIGFVARSSTCCATALHGEIPMLYAGMPRSAGGHRQVELEVWGAPTGFITSPTRLSGGQQQRVAVAGRWSTTR